MSNELDFNKLLMEYIDFYEDTCEKEIRKDKTRLDNSDDIISEFNSIFNESLRLGQRERVFWLISRYGTLNNFKLLIEWINNGLANSTSVHKQDNLAQSQENILSFLIDKGALEIPDIQRMITVLKRREISGYPERPRKLLEFHLKRIQLDNGDDLKEDSLIEDSRIKDNIKEAFKFMLNTDPRTNEHILSVLDYEKLISWVTFYFTNDFTVPKISKPIKSVNTAKGNVIYTFLLFFKTEYPGYVRPDSLFELIKACFYPFRNDKIDNMRKTRKPQYYEKVNKYGKI